MINKKRMLGICAILLLLAMPLALAENTKKPGNVIWMCKEGKTFLVGESYKQWQLTHGARMGKCDSPGTGNVIWMCKEGKTFLVGTSYMQWQLDHGSKAGKCKV